MYPQKGQSSVNDGQPSMWVNDGHSSMHGEQLYPPPPPYSEATAPPQPPPAYPFPNQPKQQPHVGRTVIIQQPVYVAAHFGDTPVRTVCPNCHSEILTRTTQEASGVQHLACLLMFCFGFWLCSCLPYCMDSLTQTRHTCPNCGTHLGTSNTS